MSGFPRIIMDEVDINHIILGYLFMATSYVALNTFRKKRSKIRTIYKEREKYGDYHTLIQRLRAEDHEMHFVYFRMFPDRFDKLLSLVGGSGLKPLSPGHRLALTLRYLSAGLSMTAVTFEYRVCKATVSKVVEEVCDAIWEVLQPIYMPTPKCGDWKTVADGFYHYKDIPNCVGSIDGKHVRIVAPKDSGSDFYNYKQSFSMVLLAVCDVYRCFTVIDVGCNGRVSDGGVFSKSTFGIQLKNSTLDLPPLTTLPGSKTVSPYFFVGDEAFPLMNNLLRPFPGKKLQLHENIYNYRISRARITIENTFGVLAARWRILHTPINAKPSKIESIIKAICILHNFISKDDLHVSPLQRKYCVPGFVDTETADGSIIPGSWRQQPQPQSTFYSINRAGCNNYSNDALNVRLNVMKYFMSKAGSLSWQVKHVTRGSN